MDPQVQLLCGSAGWVIERYDAQIETLRSAGDEIGLHTHAWRRVGTEWISDYGDQGWVNECVRVSFNAYQSAFGSACRSFRFGDHWMNDETFSLAENFGACHNLTVEPGLRPIAVALPGETSTGRFPDYAKVPREPYRPARENFRKSGETRGENNSWVIPVTTVLLPRWPTAPFYRRIVWRARYGRRSYYPLSLALEPNHFKQSISDVVEGENARHLCLVVRSDAVLDQLWAGHVRSNLEFLLSKAADGTYNSRHPKASSQN
jgi:peptidoglycan/xylan/chitin deacetylase (PgdA/CDA1 family)